MSGPQSVLLLGYGALLRSLTPGLFRLAPGARIHGVKGSPQGLEALAAETPFPLSAGDGAARLRALRPDLVLFAPPSRLAPTLCREELAPYWEACRRAGEAPPLLLSFYTAPMDYAAALGPDAPAAVLLPGATQTAGGVALGPYGRSLAWAAGPLTPAQRTWAETLLSPCGAPVWTERERLTGNLTVLVGTYLAQELRALAEPARLRAALRLPEVPGLPQKAPDAAALRDAEAFQAGIRDFILERSLPPEEAEPLLRSTLQTCLCAAQAEPEEELSRRFQVCATPGGLLEAGALAWRQAPRWSSRAIRAGARKACRAIFRRAGKL